METMEIICLLLREDTSRAGKCSILVTETEAHTLHRPQPLINLTLEILYIYKMEPENEYGRNASQYMLISIHYSKIVPGLNDAACQGIIWCVCPHSSAGEHRLQTAMGENRKEKQTLP